MNREEIKPYYSRLEALQRDPHYDFTPEQTKLWREIAGVWVDMDEMCWLDAARKALAGDMEDLRFRVEFLSARHFDKYLAE